ncbi:sensor histidine kinase [Rubellimicrobium roseum]|uniref:histidine kinase n=1 Tax=Rubellimicrobium roseum TaxID=687525 RepID=A0A5C4NL91_9RHOB|nr:PAS domain-containing protein [Rubellimicrobium roseum]TNC74760.1 PAS domain S-box protein [Rubellimicrobium roseum]
MNVPQRRDRAGDQRLRAVLRACGQTPFRLSADLSLLEILAGGKLASGAPESLADWVARRVPAEDHDALRRALAEARIRGTAIDIEHRVYQPAGGVAWMRSRAVPVTDGEGRIEEWLGAAEDVTTRREDRERLAIAIDVAGLSTWDWNLITGEVAWNDGHFRLYGYTPGEVTPDYEAWSSRVHPDDLPEVEERLRRARDEHGPYAAEFRIRPDGEGQVRWCRAAGRFERDAMGLPVRMIGIMQDVTGLKEAEARQRWLMAEFQRQVRNSLSVIRSIVRRSAQAATGKDSYATHLEGRIAAVTRVHAAMMRTPGVGLELETILRDEMQVAAVDESRMRLDGPPLRLPARMVEMMALALHELVTNAIKFGALATPAGRVEVTWEVMEDEPPCLRLFWRESGSGQARASRRKGFGTELLERMLPYSLGARTRIEHGPEGLACAIEMPLRPDRA